MNINPILKLDYPDPDVIRVEDTYYMVSTTMHFMPGCVILRSYDLINWETAVHLYDTLDSTQEQKLTEAAHIYGKGMWAASLRYHKGTYYVCFVANDTRKTYLYRAKSIEGPWQKSNIEGFYHDGSLLFDEDDRIYIAYGNTQIYLTELKEDMTGPKENGLNRILVKEENSFLGYEGAHFYKINGTYYLFLIHSLPTEWKRTQACFMADSLEDEFKGGDIWNDDMGYFNQGVAQGGIVDTPEGDWYGILFQDRGAVGRIPVLLPMTWENKFPAFDASGKTPLHPITKSTRPNYRYKPLVTSDDFTYSRDLAGKITLKDAWEWNHEPDNSLWSVTNRLGAYSIYSGKISANVEQAVNTLTQRMLMPACSGTVTVDGSAMKPGDYAGICALQGCYGLIALHRAEDGFYLVMLAKTAESSTFDPQPEAGAGTELGRVKIEDSRATLKVVADFNKMRDEAEFYYLEGNQWKQLGITHKLYFKLDHFTGCRFGLFLFSTKETGGIADFMDFRYGEGNESCC